MHIVIINNVNPIVKNNEFPDIMLIRKIVPVAIDFLLYFVFLILIFSIIKG